MNAKNDTGEVNKTLCLKKHAHISFSLTQQSKEMMKQDHVAPFKTVNSRLHKAWALCKNKNDRVRCNISVV